MYAHYGLDKPVMEQFFTYVAGMLHGDLGISYNINQNMPIADMVGSRLGITLALGLQAGVLGTFVGLVLGVIAGLKRRTVWDSLTTVVAVLGVSLPSFVFALFLSYFLGYKLQLFPLLYSQNMPVSSTVMPTIALSMFTIASVARYTRSEMVNVMASDYMMLAQSKGLPTLR